MALLKSLALGAIAAISVPAILRGASGLPGEIARYGTVVPVPGTFGFAFSLPIFAVAAIFAYLLFRASDA